MIFMLFSIAVKEKLSNKIKRCCEKILDNKVAEREIIKKDNV